jgi:hypothetical protein
MALTDDELENLAQQVIDTSRQAPDDGDGYSFHHDEFVAFARAVEAAEREACAKLCEQLSHIGSENQLWMRDRCIAAIRSRSNVMCGA